MFALLLTMIVPFGEAIFYQKLGGFVLSSDAHASIQIVAVAALTRDGMSNIIQVDWGETKEIGGMGWGHQG